MSAQAPLLSLEDDGQDTGVIDIRPKRNIDLDKALLFVSSMPLVIAMKSGLAVRMSLQQWLTLYNKYKYHDQILNSLEYIAGFSGAMAGHFNTPPEIADRQTCYTPFKRFRIPCSQVARKNFVLLWVAFANGMMVSVYLMDGVIKFYVAATHATTMSDLKFWVELGILFGPIPVTIAHMVWNVVRGKKGPQYKGGKAVKCIQFFSDLLLYASIFELSLRNFSATMNTLGFFSAPLISLRVFSKLNFTNPYVNFLVPLAIAAIPSVAQQRLLNSKTNKNSRYNVIIPSMMDCLAFVNFADKAMIAFLNEDERNESPGWYYPRLIFYVTMAILTFRSVASRRYYCRTTASASQHRESLEHDERVEQSTVHQSAHNLSAQSLSAISANAAADNSPRPFTPGFDANRTAGKQKVSEKPESSTAPKPRVSRCSWFPFCRSRKN